MMKQAKADSETPEVEESASPGHKHRLALGVAVAMALPAIALAVEAARLRRKQDPEAGEVITEPLDEDVRYIESFDGTRLYAEQLGSGPTLVLIHGWFCNTDSWHYQKKHLSEHYRVISYDQRGHRYSPLAHGEPITTEALAQDLKAVLDTLAPDEPVVLAGHSMGGMSILRFCDMYADELGSRVRGVALVDTANVPLYDCVVGGTALGVLQKPVVEPLFRWVVAHPRFADSFKHVAVNTGGFLVATRYFGYGRGASLAQLEWITDMAEATSLKGACQAGLGLIGRSSEIPLDELRKSGIPVLIWVGKNDKLTRPRVSERMHMELPESQLYVIERTGHPSYMEEYARFNDVLDRLARQAFEMQDQEA